MKITRTRTLRFNIGRFEHLETSATVEVDTEELDHTHQGAGIYANRLLDELLQEDIDRADQVSVIPEDETTVHAWKDSL